MRCLVVLCSAVVGCALLHSAEPVTERQYLSGHGPSDAVPWDFTVSAGRRAGEATTIPVPSQWELHGFGSYHYGQERNKSDERGTFQTRFNVPATWQGRRVRLVFEGVMTDTRVTLNDRAAGPTHQGGFTRFRYDITPLLKFGDGAGNQNTLRVEVAKVSSDAQTELAERGGDYWVFGGIYRPVWLEALPATAVDHVAIDARADGTFSADIGLSVLPARSDGLKLTPLRLDARVLLPDGTPAGPAISQLLASGGAGRARVTGRIQAPRLWSAETPQLYILRLALHSGEEVIHVATQRFGFRTFEVRDGKGLFVNGQRILLKGANRHSFRPETGRALSRENCYEDVRLMRSLNMNAARMSHYPPDEAFLDACDELGLYVLDELSGWQRAHGTAIGRILLREMIERDVNHPSIVLWDNGNEGGWNRDLDGDFALFDPQQRRVLHPQDTFSGIDTRHYAPFADLALRLRGPHLVMPTEFLHGMYDGGSGSGLVDQWDAITRSPYGAGGFLWVLADEGIVRTDQGNRIDAFSTFGPDGIVGPRHEREGSYYTIRDVWSPVQIDPPVLDATFNGALNAHNRFDFTSLSACRFTWRLVSFKDQKTAVLSQGVAPSPDIAPHGSGQLKLVLPSTWRAADALQLTAFDPTGAELWAWSWAAPGLAGQVASLSPKSTASTNPTAATVETGDTTLTLRAGAVAAEFDRVTGVLRTLRRGAKTATLTNGPRLAYARPVNAAPIVPLTMVDAPAGALIRRIAAPALANAVELALTFDRDQAWIGIKLELSSDGGTWRTCFDSTRRPGDGFKFSFPPQRLSAVRISNLRTCDGRPVALKSIQPGYAAGRFPPALSAAAVVTSGTERLASTGQTVAWVEALGSSGLARARWTLRADGALKLDYRYALEGDFVYHGITFDHAEEGLTSLRWLGEGPARVWQNRLRGTWLGWHASTSRNQQPGESWNYPELEGCYAGVHTAELVSAGGSLTVAALPAGTYLRVGTPRISHPNTTVDFPPGDLSVLHAIPAMGAKFNAPEVTGPSGLPAHASGMYAGSVTFRF